MPLFLALIVAREALEIKCLYSKRDTDLQEAVKEKGFYLEHTANGMKLLDTHEYSYQVQGQLVVYGYMYIL